MAELLTKERLAEVFQRIDQGYHMTLRNQIFEDVLKLRDHIRALEAQLANSIDRQRAVILLRASGDEYGAPEYYAAANIVESLPAISEQEKNSEG